MKVRVDYQTELVTEECWVCGVAFALPWALSRSMERTGEGFCCPRGCKLRYGEPLAVKLQREKDALFVRLSAREAELFMERNKTAAAERKAKRVACGVCPHCNRSFTALARHMKTKHPAEAARR